MAGRHPVTEPAPDDHRGWAEWWGVEAAWAIRQAVAAPHYTTLHDMDLDHAVRAARCAVWHAAKVLGKERT